MSSRRRFLQQSALAAASTFAASHRLLAAVPGAATVFTPQNTYLYTHGMMTEAAFRRQIGVDFTLVLEDGSLVRMRLAEVLSLDAQVASPGTPVQRPGVALPGTQLGASDEASSAQDGTVPVSRAGARAAATGVRAGLTPRNLTRATAPTLSGFHVTFTVRGEAPAQGSYTVESPSNGPMVLFLVPGGEGGGRQTCTASIVTLR